MLTHMKQLLVEIDDDMAARLERVAPARSRRRSEFIRQALRTALWAVEEARTAKAYRRTPDSTEADTLVVALASSRSAVSARSNGRWAMLWAGPS